MGRDVGRRMDRRRQWAWRGLLPGRGAVRGVARVRIDEGGLGRSVREAISVETSNRQAWTRIWTFRSMRYSVMLAIRALPGDTRTRRPAVRTF